MKPAFPNWLRRIDPFLAKEDENLLFQFFRERRARGRRWGWSMFVVPGTVLWAFASVGLYALAVSLNTISLITLVIFFNASFGLVALYYVIVRNKSLDRSTFPSTIRGFLPYGGISAPAVTDLWLAGLQAKDIGETWGLEWAEYTKGLVLPLAACPPLVAIVLFRHADPFLLAAASIVALMFSAHIVLCVVFAAAWAADNLVDVLLKYTHFRLFILKNAWEGLLGIVVSSVIGLLGWKMIASPVARFWREEPFMNPFELSQASGDLALLLMTAAVALAVVFYPVRSWIQNWREKSLRKAGPLLEELVWKLQDDSEASDTKTRQSVPVASARG